MLALSLQGERKLWSWIDNLLRACADFYDLVKFTAPTTFQGGVDAANSPDLPSNVMWGVDSPVKRWACSRLVTSISYIPASCIGIWDAWYGMFNPLLIRGLRIALNSSHPGLLLQTSASCFSSFWMVRNLLRLHWGLGLRFFLGQVCNCLPFRNSSRLKGKFWTTDPNPIPESVVDLLHIPIDFWCEFWIHNCTPLFPPQFSTPARIKSKSCGARIPVPLRPNVGHSGYPSVCTISKYCHSRFFSAAEMIWLHDMFVICETKVSSLTKKNDFTSHEIFVFRVDKGDQSTLPNCTGIPPLAMHWLQCRTKPLDHVTKQ